MAHASYVRPVFPLPLSYVTLKSGAIETYMRLLRLPDNKAYNEHILLPAATEAERDSRVNEAIKLYNLSGAYETVVACLARFLGDSITESASEESARLEGTAREILRHYERTNRAAGRERAVVAKLLNAREARECKEAGRADRALELMEMMEIVPLNGDQTAIRRAGETLMHQDDAISRNLGYFLQMMMEILKQQRDALRYSNSVDPHVRSFHSFSSPHSDIWLTDSAAAGGIAEEGECDPELCGRVEGQAVKSRRLRAHIADGSRHYLVAFCISVSLACGLAEACPAHAMKHLQITAVPRRDFRRS